MWPFKKKIGEVETHTKFTSVICIPGNWKDDQELKLKIIEVSNGKYIAAGNVMMSVKDEQHFKFEFCESDDRMKASFDVAGRVTGVTKELLDTVEQHNSVLYLSAETGSMSSAMHLVNAARVVLEAGGIGIKVETAGKAFSKEDWLSIVNYSEETIVYETFVIDCLVDQDGSVFTCGMQNLGLKDTIVSNLSVQDSIELIRLFGYYQIVDKPMILPNQTFTPAPDSYVYTITEEKNHPYKYEELFSNPFGSWRLTKI